MKTWMSLTATLLLLLIVVLALQERRRADALEAAVASAEATLAGLQREKQMLEHGIADAENAAEEREKLAAVRRPTRHPPITLGSQYLQSPDVTRAAFRPIVRKYFAKFYADAGLSPQQIERFEAAEVQIGPALEMFLMAASSGQENREAQARTEMQMVEFVSEQAREIFGDEVAEQFAAAVRARDIRRAVDDLAVRTHHTEAPLTAPQSQHVEALLLEAGAAAAAAGDRLTLASLDWDLVMRRAATLLAPGQLRALEALRAKAMFDREYERITGFPAFPKLPEPER